MSSHLLQILKQLIIDALVLVFCWDKLQWDAEGRAGHKSSVEEWFLVLWWGIKARDYWDANCEVI